jgi:hypothetical protein
MGTISDLLFFRLSLIVHYSFIHGFFILRFMFYRFCFRDELAFGPRIDFREHSFLSNPHTPPSVRQSRLQVALCQPGSHTDASKADTKCLTASQLAKEPTVRETLNLKP